MAPKAVRELSELADKLREKGEVEASDEALRKAKLSTLIDNEELKLAWLLAATAEADPSSGDEKLKQALNILKDLKDSSPNSQNQAKDRSDQLNQVKAFVYFQAGELNDDNSNFSEDSPNYYNQAYKALKDSKLNTYKTDIETNPENVETNPENVETNTLLCEQDVVNIYSRLISSTLINISSSDEIVISFRKYLYDWLENKLKNKNWKEADKVTSRTIWELAGTSQERSFQAEVSQKFPCEDLRNIDELWTEYSDGRFGFSVQRSIWQSSEVNGDISKFMIRVGWGDWGDEDGKREDGKRVFYFVPVNDFSDNALKEGQLPWLVAWSGSDGIRDRKAYLSKIVRCGI